MPPRTPPTVPTTSASPRPSATPTRTHDAAPRWPAAGPGRAGGGGYGGPMGPGRRRGHRRHRSAPRPARPGPARPAGRRAGQACLRRRPAAPSAPRGRGRVRRSQTHHRRWTRDRCARLLRQHLEDPGRHRRAPGHSPPLTAATVPTGVPTWAGTIGSTGASLAAPSLAAGVSTREAGGRRSLGGAEPGVKPSASTPTIAAPSAPPPRTATPMPRRTPPRLRASIEEALAGRQVEERALEVWRRGALATGEAGQPGLDPALALDEVTAGVAGVDVGPRLLRLCLGELAVEERADAGAEVTDHGRPASETAGAGPA